MTAHTLYRFFDADGALLYVGRTIDARSRWRSHERAAEWFDQVATVTREVHPDADFLAQAEMDAIVSEHPRHNVVWNASKRKPQPVEPEFIPMLMSPANAAKFAGTTEDALRLAASLGEVELVHIGRLPRFITESLVAYRERGVA